MAQLGRALRSGRRGRGFESRQPDQFKNPRENCVALATACWHDHAEKIHTPHFSMLRRPLKPLKLLLIRGQIRGMGFSGRNRAGAPQEPADASSLRSFPTNSSALFATKRDRGIHLRGRPNEQMRSNRHSAYTWFLTFCHRNAPHSNKTQNEARSRRWASCAFLGELPSASYPCRYPRLSWRGSRKPATGTGFIPRSFCDCGLCACLSSSGGLFGFISRCRIWDS